MHHPPAPSDSDPADAFDANSEDLGPTLLPTRSLGVVAVVLFVLFDAVVAVAATLTQRPDNPLPLLQE